LRVVVDLNRDCGTGLKFTALGSLPFSEPLTRSFGLHLVRLAAERVPKFVTDREGEKLVKGDIPLL
jgi:hypothetical protein